MSILQLYTTLLTAPLVTTAFAIPYRLYKRIAMKRENGEWNSKDYFQAFVNLSQAKTPKELTARIAPLHLSQSRPYIHQGVLGVDSQEEAEERIGSIETALMIATGAVTASIPVFRFFSRCLDSAGMGPCAQTAAQDLISYSGIQLFAGAYLVSHFVKVFFITPILLNLSQNRLDNQVVFSQLSIAYKNLFNALNEILDKPADDPKFSETAKMARQFLRLLPLIEQDLHNTLALDRKQAQTLLLPLRIACRQILLKASLCPPKPVEEAKPAAAPEETKIEPSAPSKNP